MSDQATHNPEEPQVQIASKAPDQGAFASGPEQKVPQPTPKTAEGDVGAAAVQPAASTRPASSSSPQVKVVAGGKPRPSVANKKRVRDASSPKEANADVPDAKEASSDQDVQEQPSTRKPLLKKGQKKKKKRGPLFFTLVGVLVVLLICVGVCSAFACARWVFVQDEADIQGTWALRDAESAISIDDAQIDLAGEAKYDYTLDIQAKTISTSFTGLSGCAHYRFSADRKSVALIEQGDFTWTGTLLSDLQWMWNDFCSNDEATKGDPLGSDTGIVLYRQD